MKRIFKTILILIVLFLGFNSNAQSILFKGGLNVNSLKSSTTDANITNENSYGFHLGATVDLPLTNLFSLETGLILNNRGGKMVFDSQSEIMASSNDVIDPLSTTPKPLPMETEITASLYYLDIPLLLRGNLKLNENIKLFGTFGPYLGIALKGTSEIETNMPTELIEMFDYEAPSKEDVEIGSENGQMKRLDSGLSFGTGIEFNSIVLGLSYDLGLMNTTNSETDKTNNRVFKISLGYKLGL